MSHAGFAQHMQVLGVNPGDTADAVRTAWRCAVKKHHPDLAGVESHDKMAKINAAYEALKSGVPSDPYASERKEAASRSRPTKTSSTLNYGTFDFTDKDRAILKQQAIDRLVADGIRPTNVGVVGRLLRRKGRFPLHLPKRFVVGHGNILVVLDTPRMHQGKNYIAVPTLALKDGNLVASDFFTVVPVSVMHKSIKLSMAAGDGLGQAFLPNYSGFKTYISNS